jgi:hypothetical protein
MSSSISYSCKWPEMGNAPPTHSSGTSSTGVIDRWRVDVVDVTTVVPVPVPVPVPVSPFSPVLPMSSTTSTMVAVSPLKPNGGVYSKPLDNNKLIRPSEPVKDMCPWRSGTRVMPLVYSELRTEMVPPCEGITSTRIFPVDASPTSPTSPTSGSTTAMWASDSNSGWSSNIVSEWLTWVRTGKSLIGVTCRYTCSCVGSLEVTSPTSPTSPNTNVIESLPL